MLKVLCSARSKNNSISPAAVILTRVSVMNTMSSKKSSHTYGCAYILCVGRSDKPDAVSQMCDAPIHGGCFEEVLCGLPTDEVARLVVCSPQCFRYYKDDALSSEEIKESRLSLLAQNKMELLKLAQDLGAKVSYRVPGGTPHNLSKEGVIICRSLRRGSAQYKQRQTIMQAITMQVQEAVALRCREVIPGM